MKRWIPLATILLLGIGAALLSQRKQVETSADPAPILYLVADTEQELTRMPVRFARMSDQEEIAIGDQIAKSYDLEWEKKRIGEERDLQAYVEKVGARLVPYAHRKLPYRFHYIPEEYFINAFALPGGHIFIGKGLISLMDSEDELASVIGHEIEHVDHYHCAERIQQQQALRKVPFSELIALPLEIFEAGYSKDQELEADREGTRMTVQAAYSANGAIRMFETFQRIYEQYHLQARTPQQEVSNIALQALEGYFRSHPLPSERIAQLRTLVASEHWDLRAETELAVAYIFWTDHAEQALKQGKYAIAEQLATRSLMLQPSQPLALEAMARAQFAQAHFSASASTWRKLLDMGGPQDSLVKEYAYTLAAADRTHAAQEFQTWAGTSRENDRTFKVQLAGLQLLAGNPRAASVMGTSGSDVEPEILSELGWWYYKAGDYPSAVDLLARAYQQRPGDVTTFVRLGFAQIEMHRLADAIQTLDTVQYESAPSPSDQSMGRAVCRWQAQQPDEALRSFEAGINAAPEWGNTRWVEALYSPLVTQSVEQMRAEVEKRKSNTASR